jgi:hypothetical protein
MGIFTAVRGKDNQNGIEAPDFGCSELTFVLRIGAAEIKRFIFLQAEQPVGKIFQTDRFGSKLNASHKVAVPVRDSKSFRPQRLSRAD